MESSSGPGREIWFPVRERGGGLLASRRRRMLITNGLGVYSLAHRRYIRKTRNLRYLELAVNLASFVKAYRSLQKLGMKNWPEHDKKARMEITLWKRKLMDVYWDALPEKRRASATERYVRVQYKQWMLYTFLAYFVGRMGVSLARGMLLERYMPTWSLLILVLLIWCVVALTEKVVTAIVEERGIFPRSVIYKILEFELTN